MRGVAGCPGLSSCPPRATGGAVCRVLHERLVEMALSPAAARLRRFARMWHATGGRFCGRSGHAEVRSSTSGGTAGGRSGATFLCEMSSPESLAGCGCVQPAREHHPAAARPGCDGHPPAVAQGGPDYLDRRDEAEHHPEARRGLRVRQAASRAASRGIPATSLRPRRSTRVTSARPCLSRSSPNSTRTSTCWGRG